MTLKTDDENREVVGKLLLQAEDLCSYRGKSRNDKVEYLTVKLKVMVREQVKDLKIRNEENLSFVPQHVLEKSC